MKSMLRLSRAAPAALLVSLIAWDAAPAAAASPGQAPPVPPGQARVWFLRQLLPGTQFHPPMIYVNGVPIASSAEGTAFYRDFAPGRYAFDAENCVPQPRTGQLMTLQPNTQYALEVTSDENGAWDCNPPQFSYLRQVPPQQVPYLFAQVTFEGAR